VGGVDSSDATHRRCKRGQWRTGERAGDTASGCGLWRRRWGFSQWSLHRWMNASKRHGRFQPVQIVTSVPPPAPSVVIELPAIGARVASLDVETTAQLLTRLR
jgi:hypothetical protein